MQITLTLAHASAISIYALAAAPVVKTAIRDTHAWWRLIALALVGALLWKLLHTDPTGVLAYMQPFTAGGPTSAGGSRP